MKTYLIKLVLETLHHLLKQGKMLLLLLILLPLQLVVLMVVAVAL